MKRDKRCVWNNLVCWEQLKESMEYMSNYSRYAYEQEIKQGFLTIRGGHRVGDWRAGSYKISSTSKGCNTYPV